MWVASGAAIAHAPNLTELREPDTGGANIEFDSHGHSKRDVGPEELQRRMTERRISLGPSSAPEPKKQLTSQTQGSVAGSRTSEKETWNNAIWHGLCALWKFFLTPTGFCITIYGLNVVAWGAMLFFLLSKAAPAMNHPENGDADSSPRKTWIEIDSQILNALFCLTAWGLAPWRFVISIGLLDGDLASLKSLIEPFVALQHEMNLGSGCGKKTVKSKRPSMALRHRQLHHGSWILLFG